MITRDELLEWAEVFGNYYGTSRRFWEEACGLGRDMLLDIDVQGAAQVKLRIPDAISVFILPPSREVLERRLRGRGQDSQDVIAKRLLNAGREILGYVRYDYVLINQDLDRSAERLRAIVLAERGRRNGIAPQEPLPASPERIQELAEACRTERVREEIKPILDSFGGYE
jgi:guanylate kinase